MAVSKWPISDRREVDRNWLAAFRCFSDLTKVSIRIASLSDEIVASLGAVESRKAAKKEERVAIELVFIQKHTFARQAWGSTHEVSPVAISRSNDCFRLHFHAIEIANESTAHR